MIKKLSKLKKYLLVNEKYYNKFKELGIKYTKEVCKAIDAEYLGYYTKFLYPHIQYKDKEYQAGDFNPYFYSNDERLSDVLEKELEDDNKTISTKCKKDSKKV